MSERQLVSFELRSDASISSSKLVQSTVFSADFAAGTQVDRNTVRLVIAAYGDSTKAVMSATSKVWDALDSEEIEAEIRRSFFGEIDCSELVRNLEDARASLQLLEVDVSGCDGRRV